MFRFLSKILLSLIFIATFISCDDDSIFDAKVCTKNGITTVSGIRAGGLERAFFIGLSSVKHLVINDTIDSRDFQTMRDEMPNLEILDLSGATIAAYNGYEGTNGLSTYYYAANDIPEYAFYDSNTPKGKKNLKTIILPQNITSIRDYAFAKCGLTGTLVIPSSVKDTIGRSAFAYCEDLTGLTLAPTKFFGVSAFQGCTSLTGNLVFPDSVLTIKSFAFAFCDKVNAITVPSTLNEIENSAFSGCGGLFTVDAGNITYSASGGVLYSVDGSTLLQFPASKTGNFEIPATVISVGPFAFANNTLLTSVTIPASVQVFEDNAFLGCSALTGNFTIPAALWYVGVNVFEGCEKITGFNVSSDNTLFSFTDGMLIDKSQFTVKRCVSSKTGSCIIPSDIMFIDNSAFSDCNKITSVTIPENVLSIGKRAFFNCKGLTDVYVKSITPVDISESLSAFELVDKNNCTLHIPKGTTSEYLKAAGWNEFGNIVEN